MNVIKTSTPNLEKVLKNKDLSPNIEVELGLATAYEDSIASAERVSEVEQELADKAKSVILEEPAAPEVKNKNMYTKLTLDESFDDFDINQKTKQTDDEDKDLDYLDYDMYDFCYGIAVAEEWPRIKNPLDHPIRRFMYTGSDDYIKTKSNVGESQVGTDYDGNIVLSADSLEAFEDIIAVCDYYKIKVGKPVPRRSSYSRWKYSVTIYVPTTADGYPMMAEDFFAEQGLTLSDVIEDAKIGGGKTSNWGDTYVKKAEKDRKEAAKLVNDNTVEEVYKKWFDRAANSNDPLEGFLKGMFAEMAEKELAFSKVKLKKKFMDAFNDDYVED